MRCGISPPVPSRLATGQPESLLISGRLYRCSLVVGGWTLVSSAGSGFGRRYYDALPYEIVWANDLNASACATYKANLKHAIHTGDIADVVDTLPKRADEIIGGFPCQDVSINGPKTVANGSRTILYRSMVDVIQRVKPRAFVAENVKGLLQAHAQKFFTQMVTEFEATGYAVTYKVYLSADFGVPQMRERVIIVGTKRRAFEHLEPELQSSDYITAKDALGDLESEPENLEASHLWSKAARRPEQGDRRLKADRPSTTIRAEHHGNVQWHYSQPRRLSLREAARLQSFPDAFTFKSGMRETERQIGNAVPPVLAWHLAKALSAFLDA